MTCIDSTHYGTLSAGSHAHVELQCDSGKNPKCLDVFSREKRIAEKQRARTGGKDFCKFCQKTEEFSGRTNPNAKYAIDDNLLSVVDTEEKAYLLGWIASDGSIHTNGTITISIKARDIDVLHKLRKIVCSSLPIKERDRGMAAISINSTKMAADCCKHLGIATAGPKAATIKFPEAIPAEMVPSFIRGYFEGDGSISLHHRVPRVSIASNSKAMLEAIGRHIGVGAVYSAHSEKEQYSYQTTNGKDTLLALEYLYGNAHVGGLFLDRKYDKYCKVRSWVPSKSGAGNSIKFNTTTGLIRFNKARQEAVLPNITDIHASGIDLHLIDKVSELAPDVSLYTTGIKALPPEGYFFMLVGRSSISKSGFSLANSVGIIDENYVGEIMVALRKHTSAEPEFPARLVQLVLMPKINAEFTIVDTLEETERGTGGFGSTGK